MPRRVFLSLSIFSLALTAVACVYWLRGYYGSDLWVQTSPPGVVYAMKVRGNEATFYRLRSAKAYPDRNATLISFPVSYVVSLFGLAALLSGSYAIRSRPIKAGVRAQCGYDLRASPQRCPECATPAPGAVV